MCKYLAITLCKHWILHFIARMDIVKVDMEEIEIVVHVDTARRDVRVNVNRTRDVLHIEYATDSVSH